jgi:hypothetical protein
MVAIPIPHNRPKGVLYTVGSCYGSVVKSQVPVAVLDAVSASGQPGMHNLGLPLPPLTR